MKFIMNDENEKTTVQVVGDAEDTRVPPSPSPPKNVFFLMLENIQVLEAKLLMKNQELDAVREQKDLEITSLKQEQAREIALLKQQKDTEIASIKHHSEQEKSFLRIAKDKEIESLKKLISCKEQDKPVDVVGKRKEPAKLKKNSLFLELVHMTCDFNKIKKEKDNAKYNADNVAREQLSMTKTIEDLQKVLAEQHKEVINAKHHADKLEMEQLDMSKTIEELKKLLEEQRGEFETCKQENEILHELKDELMIDRSAFQQKCIELKNLVIDARRK